MSEPAPWRHLLEAANGEWAIAAGWLSIFLTYHLAKVGAQRRIWRRGWISLPLSMQMAVAMLAISVAVLVTRAIIWFSRYTHDGAIYGGDSVLFAAATALGIIGFLCALRVVTRPMIGRWPWWCAVASSVLYLVWTAARFI